MESQILKDQPILVAKPPIPRVGWTVYLLLMTALIGGPGATFFAPIKGIGGLFSRRLSQRAGAWVSAAIHFYLKSNIHVKASADLSFPPGFGMNDKPALIIANHRSNLDVFFLIAYINNIRIVAKRALWYVPFLGLMMMVMRMIPVSRGNLKSLLTAVESARKGLRQGDVILFFPEGKRCVAEQQGTSRFYPTAFSLAREENVPVYPVVFVNTDRVWPRGKFGMTFRAAGVKIKSLEPLLPADFDSATAMMNETKRRIDDYLLKNS